LGHVSRFIGTNSRFFGDVAKTRIDSKADRRTPVAPKMQFCPPAANAFPRARKICAALPKIGQALFRKNCAAFHKNHGDIADREC